MDYTVLLQKGLEFVSQATALDAQRNFREALKMYQLALESFISVLKYEKNERIAATLRPKVKEYMNRAEEIQQILDSEEQQAKNISQLFTAVPSPPTTIAPQSNKTLAPPLPSNPLPPLPSVNTLPPPSPIVPIPPVQHTTDQHHPISSPANASSLRPTSIKIQQGQKGISYETLFGQYLVNCSEIAIEDPYIRANHQVLNFLRFCELAVKKSSVLKKIYLVTTTDEENKAQIKLEEIRQSLADLNIDLQISYSATLHDRQIVLNNGWTIKIGRGLDIYQPSKGKFSIGFLDMELRPTLETTVDIYKSS